MTALQRLVRWASSFTLANVPNRVVELAKSQVLSQLAAIRAGASHPDGRRLLAGYGPALHRDARRSAFVLAALSSWLHFDDTAYAGHLGNSTVTVPLAYAHANGLTGRELLTAVIAANECAARLTAATTLGPFRGLLAAHTHVAGAIAAWSRCVDAPARSWVDAFGLALSMPPWNLTHGFLASDARLLTCAVALRHGLEACVAAANGLRGASDILEHPAGFLARFADVPLPRALTAGLGRRWHTDTLSFKVHPSGPGTDAAVDCARTLAGKLHPLNVTDVAEVVIHTSIYTCLVEAAVAGYLDGPDSSTSALLSATAYPVATALLTGNLKPADFAEPACRDPARWALAGKIRVIPDDDLSACLLAATAPFGEALRLAGDGAAGWLTAFGGERLARLAAQTTGRYRDDRSLVAAAKATPARVVVRLRNGRTLTAQLDCPVGAAGSPSREHHRALMVQKFRSVGGPAKTEQAIAELDRLSATEVRGFIRAALRTGRHGTDLNLA